MSKKIKKIKVIRKFHCADINHDCVVMELLNLGHKNKGKHKTIHGTGEFYDVTGHSIYVIYDNGISEESELLEVCIAADVELDEEAYKE